MTKQLSALTRSEEARRVLIISAANCAERALYLHAAAHPHDRPRKAIEGTRAWARGDIRVGEARKLSFAAHAAARQAKQPEVIAAARVCEPAAGVAHMAGHARVAADDAVKAISLTDHADPVLVQ